MTFEEWCLRNNRHDLLDRWNYDLNNKAPSDVAYRTKNRYYFLTNTEESELKQILGLTTSEEYGKYKDKASRRENLTGQTFGELTVLSLDEYKTNNTDNYHSYWICQCSCGNKISVKANHLKIGHTFTCGNRAIHYSGKNNPSWKGGVTPENNRIRSSINYKEYRESVLNKDNHSCIICGAKNNLEVHHIFPFAIFPDDRFRVDCGCTICKNHHTGSYDSFHKVYGTHNNTPEQLEEYVNAKRCELGNYEYFDVYAYMNSYDADCLEIDDTMLDLYE